MKRLLFFFGIILLNFTANAQCAMCRASVESTYSDGHYLSGSGLNTGILYLLAMPYILVSVMGYLWWSHSGKETAQKWEISQRIRQALGR